MFSRARDGVLVPNGTLASQGEKLAAAERVDRREVALAVEPSWATRPELLVEGVTFYPRIREDMEHAESSIHVIRFGFKPGTVGDVFAELLERRARQGIAVRLIVDENGSAASGRSRAMYERLAEAGAEIVVNVGSKLRAARGPVAGDRGIVWNLRNAGHIDHRKMVIVDGRVGWVGRAGFEDHFADGRFHDLFVRFEGEVVSQLQLVFVASFRYHACGFPAGTEALFPSQGARPDDAVDDWWPTTRRVGTARSRRRSGSSLRARPRRSTSSTRTSRIAAQFATPHGRASWRTCPPRRTCRAQQLACAAPPRSTTILPFCQRVSRSRSIRRWSTRKALLRDGHDVLVGTCNLEAWSFKRFYEIDVRFDSPELARSFDEDFFAPAIAVSRAGTVAGSRRERARNAAFAVLSPSLTQSLTRKASGTAAATRPRFRSFCSPRDRDLR